MKTCACLVLLMLLFTIVHADAQIKDGIEKTYYESGALKDEIPFVNGRVHGVMRRYYESGSLQNETTAEEGKMKELK